MRKLSINAKTRHIPMLAPRSNAVCLLCRFGLSGQTRPALQSATWHLSRSITEFKGRARPKRMSLSPNVSKPSISPASRSPNFRRRVRSPFAAMNQRSANVPQSPRAPSAAEVKRSSRQTKPPEKERELFHALKMQKTLSEVSYGRRNAIKAKIEETDNFEDFDLLPTIKESVTAEALAGLSDVAPTPIQRVAIPRLLGQQTAKRRGISKHGEGSEMSRFLLAAETGSGKTLAYLLPTLNAIKEAEATEIKLATAQKLREEKELQSLGPHGVLAPPLNSAANSDVARPKAIILLPTSELVSQVGAVVKAFSHTVKFRSALISSAYSGKVIRKRVFAPGGIDILISTPHLLASISESDPNILSRVTHLVIDEADSLLDRSFSPSTTAIIDKSTPSLKQLILCSATIPRSLDSLLRQRFPEIQRLVTPNLHAIPRRVQLGVVDIDKTPYQGNRMLACADTIWTIGKAGQEEGGGGGGGNSSSSSDAENHESVKRMLVFVNEREKSLEVTQYLTSKGIDAVALNRDTPEQRQVETLHEFTTRDPKPSSPEHEDSTGNERYVPVTQRSSNSLSPAIAGGRDRKLHNTKVLVATDLGSRGIDTLAVRHVILYDVPHTTIDFIHRLGRVGRMGRRGRGIVLVGKHDRKDVVREVREGMFKGQALI